MRRRFNEEQIIAILKEQEAGLGTVDLCRKHGISSAIFYKWKAKYGPGGVGRWRRMTLEDENTRLIVAFSVRGLRLVLDFSRFGVHLLRHHAAFSGAIP
ncbi:MAG: hypothetical protein ABS76_07805 [Pelagibacterium sp. SCN 64-44]|nr:MAG: hypothetical protein ABS76_07805 [Pelagibacterium sp. SCN 64-44]